MQQKNRVLLSCVFGNALEFYDFTLYGFFASILASTFFPAENPTNSLIASWGAFAAGFLMRPFGASLFGYLGDRVGRKNALSLSIVLMAIPTLIIGILPSYETLGLAAPLIIVSCRLLQGLCTGGEYNGAAIFALEHASEKRAGLTGSIITGSCVLGALIAIAFAFIATKDSMPPWAWRVPFVLGTLISLVGFYMRRSLSESPEFKQLQKEKLLAKNPLMDVLRKHRTPFIITSIIGALNGALSYTLYVFLNIYISKYLGHTLNEAIFYNIFGLLVYMFACPFFGILLDHLGQVKYMARACLGVLFAVFPVFYILHLFGCSGIFLGQVGLGLLAASIAGPQHALVQKLFPPEDRYSGISFSYSLGMGICGGTAPMVFTYLIDKTGNIMMPAFFIMAWALLCFIAVLKSKHYLKSSSIKI